MSDVDVTLEVARALWDGEHSLEAIALADPIVGKYVDSLGVALLLGKLEAATGVRLLGRTDVVMPGGPLSSVGALIAYLEEQLG